MTQNSNIIAQSKSGRTYIILNEEDNTIGLNNNTPLFSTSQLKWLFNQPNVKMCFLKRVPQQYLDVQEEFIDLASLPVECKEIVSKDNYNNRIEPYVITYLKCGNAIFRHYSNTGDYVFSEYCAYTNLDVTKSNQQLIADFKLSQKIADEKAAERNRELLAEMYESLKGWYVVTIGVLVSKIGGNDGVKTYSFRVLADNQMDAYNKACNLVMNGGLKDSNVSFVYHVNDSPASALIEYVGVWTDETELEYGPSK